MALVPDVTACSLATGAELARCQHLDVAEEGRSSSHLSFLPPSLLPSFPPLLSGGHVPSPHRRGAPLQVTRDRNPGGHVLG